LVVVRTTAEAEEPRKMLIEHNLDSTVCTYLMVDASIIRRDIVIVKEKAFLHWKRINS
jgi:hypothetical protein